jgi:hypothetical protein
MNKLPEICSNELHLILLPRPMRRQVANTLIARLALRGAVRVLDGGNHFDAHGIARALRSETHHLKTALERVQVARAFTCYQVISLLSESPLTNAPTLALDLLTTFYDESVPLPERLRLVEESLVQLQRLCQRAPIVVTSLPQPPDGGEQLLDCLETGADQVWRFELEQPEPALRLF